VKNKADKLQELAESLPFARAEFDADDVRERLGARATPAPYRRVAAAAAVFLLVLTHAAAFWAGGRDVDLPAAAADPVVETERILTRASELDPGAPHALLSDELGALRRDIQLAGLPGRLQLADDVRAQRFVEALEQFEQAFELVDDPAFRVLMVSGIARASLRGERSVRVLPSTARSFSRVVPVGGAQFRIYVVDSEGRVLEDEGTPEALRRRHPELRFRTKEGD
jgi:hypothetical protein